MNDYQAASEWQRGYDAGTDDAGCRQIINDTDYAMYFHVTQCSDTKAWKISCPEVEVIVAKAKAEALRGWASNLRCNAAVDPLIIASMMEREAKQLEELEK